MMFVALRRAVAAAPSSLLLGSWRGVKGKVLRKGMWDGWPKYSPDGWPYARWMKNWKGGYIPKQKYKRMQGLDKGARSRGLEENSCASLLTASALSLAGYNRQQAMHQKITAAPEFTSSTTSPVEFKGGINRPTKL